MRRKHQSPRIDISRQPLRKPRPTRTTSELTKSLHRWMEEWIGDDAYATTEVYDHKAPGLGKHHVGVVGFLLPGTIRELRQIFDEAIVTLSRGGFIDYEGPIPFPDEHPSAPISNTGLREDDPPPSGVGVEYWRGFRNGQANSDIPF